MSSKDTRAEEQQKLLGEEGESGDEQPTATDPPPPVYAPPPPPPPPPLSAVKPMGPPPEYTAQVPQYTPLPSVGYPVQLQVEGGHVVPATIVQDPSGKHMVYICDSGGTGGVAGENERPKPPRDFLALALFALICCCFPIGIVALIKSIEVNRRYNRGDYAGAVRASQQAHSWGITAVVFGVCIFFIVISIRVFFHNYHQYYYYDYN